MDKDTVKDLTLVIRQFVQDIEIISLPADAGLGIDASAVRFFPNRMG